MRLLNFKVFVKQNNMKNDTMHKSDIERAFNYPKNSKTYSDEGFVNIENGSIGGSHWVKFLVKINNS